jgi:hypothetical protein
MVDMAAEVLPVVKQTAARVPIGHDMDRSGAPAKQANSADNRERRPSISGALPLKR